MGKLKITENLFLEVNELNRFRDFIEENGYKKAMKAITKSFGVVQDEGNANFKVSAKAGSADTVIINKGLAYDSEMNAIVSESDIEYKINNTGVNRWVVLSYGTTNAEKGKVSVNIDGTLSGYGTEFTKVLRGQPNFPTKIKLSSSKNLLEYEVVKVDSDTSAVLSGDFISENDIEYSVIGTFTPGFLPNEESKCIYEYDSHRIRIIDSEERPVNISEDEFIIAMINFNGSGVVEVSDERAYCIFNNIYKSTANQTPSVNSLVSLLDVSVVGGTKTAETISTEIELIFEHGYTVIDGELKTTSNSNVFTIKNGSCNFLGSGDIPNNLFNGWLLVNRKNMKFATISNSVNKTLYLPVVDSSIIEDVDNDYIIVPDFKEVEYQITASSNVNMSSSSIPFFFKQDITNLKSRNRIYLFLPYNDVKLSEEVTLHLRYRLCDGSGKWYPFQKLSIAKFTNINGVSETLSESSLNLNVSNLEPEVKQKNYS